MRDNSRAKREGCPYCKGRVNIMNEEVRVVDMKQSREKGIKGGVYHLECYQNLLKDLGLED